MKTSQKAFLLTAIMMAAGLTGCASAGNPERAAESRITNAEMTRTALDAWRPQVAAVESRMQVGMPGAGSLTADEHVRLRAFAREYVELGRGSVAISVPVGTGNQQAAAQIAQETQRALYAYGVDWGKIASGGYQAGGEYAPVTLTFTRYEARAVECLPWSQIDPRVGGSNGPHARFGCAGAANLAAMVADPGDLLADRTGDPGDAARQQTGMEALRKGELVKASGTVKGGGQ